MSSRSPALAGGFFTTSTAWEVHAGTICTVFMVSCKPKVIPN